MSSLFLLIPLGLLQVAGGVWLFIWAVNRGQYEDLEGPGIECLRDEWESAQTDNDDEINQGD